MHTPSSFGFLRPFSACAVLAVALAGCQTTGEKTASIGNTTPVSTAAIAGASPESLRQYTQAWGARYEANPSDAQAALHYATGLRATEQRAQAIAVLQNAAVQNPDNDALMAAYGKLLADVGRYKEALDVLGRAHRPDQPNWQVLSAQGAVLDQMGQHVEARRYYDTALKISPNEPSVLANLGLSYALTQNLSQAEQALRTAAAQPKADARVRQNLALVLGLQGKFAEAQGIAQQDLGSAQAQQDMANLRKMMSQQNTWKSLAQQPKSGQMKLAPMQAEID